MDVVGRHDELETINTWLHAAFATAFVIEGEPGIGKTTVWAEAVRVAREEDRQVLRCRPRPSDAGLPNVGLTDLLRSVPDEAFQNLPPPQRRPLEVATLRRDADEGDLEPRAVGTALTAMLASLANQRPLLLAVDDAQWLDAASLAVLPAFARDAAPHRVLLLVGVARGVPDAERFDVLQGRLGRDLEGALIRLARLDQTALAELVAWAVPAYGADERDRLVRRVERDTAGIPLLAVALLEAVAAGYRLAPDAPAWPTPARTLIDSLPGTLPPAVIGAVCLRFRGLPLAAQHVLGAAAALGGRADVERLTRATGLEAVAVAQALDVLEWERWLSADAQGYLFAAPIERDIVLQEMLTPGQARRYRDQSVP